MAKLIGDQFEDNTNRNQYNNKNNKAMDFKKYIPWAIVGVLLLWGISSYNGLVSSNESVENAWGGVETAYQARADKTKNLMAIVKGASDYEKETLEAVIEARSKATSINIDANDLTPEKLAEFEKAQSQFTGSLSKLLAVVEQYPDLKAVDAYRDFQAQYEGIENRIKKARDDYNATVKTFNTKIKRFPTNLMNNMVFGFTEKPYFKAQEGSENAPDIKF